MPARATSTTKGKGNDRNRLERHPPTRNPETRTPRDHHHHQQQREQNSDPRHYDTQGDSDQLDQVICEEEETSDYSYHWQRSGYSQGDGWNNEPYRFQDNGYLDEARAHLPLHQQLPTYNNHGYVHEDEYDDHAPVETPARRSAGPRDETWTARETQNNAYNHTGRQEQFNSEPPHAVEHLTETLSNAQLYDSPIAREPHDQPALASANAPTQPWGSSVGQNLVIDPSHDSQGNWNGNNRYYEPESDGHNDDNEHNQHYEYKESDEILDLSNGIAGATEEQDIELEGDGSATTERELPLDNNQIPSPEETRDETAYYDSRDFGAAQDDVDGADDEDADTEVQTHEYNYYGQGQDMSRSASSSTTTCSTLSMSFLERKSGHPVAWKESLVCSGDLGSFVSLDLIRNLGYRKQHISGGQQTFSYYDKDEEEEEDLQILGQIELSYYRLDKPDQVLAEMFHIIERPVKGYDLLSATNQFPTGEYPIVIHAFPIEPAYNLTPAQREQQRRREDEQRRRAEEAERARQRRKAADKEKKRRKK